jgi:hypothetical protein
MVKTAEMDTVRKSVMPDDLYPFREVGVFARCMMAGACFLAGSLMVWVSRDIWGIAIGVSFAGMGFVALWLWPQWNYEPRPRLFRDLYMTMMGFFACMALHNIRLPLLRWLAFVPVIAIAVRLVIDLCERASHQQQ